MSRVSFGNFTLDAPSEWTLSTVILSGPVVQDTAAVGMPTAKAVRPFQQNVICTMEQVGPKETPKSYVSKQLEGLRKAGVQRKETAKPETIKLPDGSVGLLTEQAVVGPGGERVRQMQMVTIRQGIAHTLIASNLDGMPYEKTKAGFREILTSFK